MWYNPAALGLGIRDVIGAWIVCLAIAAVFFGCQLAPAPRDASGVQRRAAAAPPRSAASTEICARRSSSSEPFWG